MPQAPFTDSNGDTQKIDRRINPIEVAWHTSQQDDGA
jgi:hypothetical protein